MLKYQLNRQTFGNDVINLDYNYYTINNFVNSYNDNILVGITCNDVSFINNNDELSIVSNFTYQNQDTGTIDSVCDVGTSTVYAVNKLTNTVYFLDKKYKELNIDRIYAEVNDGIITWMFDFDDTHYFLELETPEINIIYGAGETVYLHTNTTYINYHQISWVYDPLVENAEELSNVLFGQIDIVDGIVEGNLSTITVTRDQVRWSLQYNQESGKWDSKYDQEAPTVMINKYRVNIDVPISLKSKTDLYLEENIKEYFVNYEIEKAVNNPIEMEKYVFHPMIVSNYKNGVPTFSNCVKINFNLHFRVHSGDNWTVNESDSWNFDKYTNNFGADGWSNNKYYSYAQSNETSNNKHRRACQSDLLTYLGFTTNDVKYQKNKLKKSFLRLSFYDTPDVGTQRLLAYSTVFVDCNKLYSKFISKSNFVCYYDDNGEIVKGIKANREVNSFNNPNVSNPNFDNLPNASDTGSLGRILKVSSLTMDEIEEYRLSSQFSVMDKYTSNNSSEGFYLYTWENDGDNTIPMDVYMKVEFNHAGYGRNIPFMAPYKDNAGGFKTNDEIITDWANPDTQYGIKKYTRFSYIHLKAKYDETLKQHIYYLDPETYGVVKDGNVVNINLYEARISFNN